MFKTAEAAFEEAFIGRLQELETEEGGFEPQSDALSKVASAFFADEMYEDEGELTYEDLLAKLASDQSQFVGFASQKANKPSIAKRTVADKARDAYGRAKKQVRVRSKMARRGFRNMSTAGKIGVGAGIGLAGAGAGYAAYKALKNRKREDD